MPLKEKKSKVFQRYLNAPEFHSWLSADILSLVYFHKKNGPVNLESMLCLHEVQRDSNTWRHPSFCRKEGNPGPGIQALQPVWWALPMWMSWLRSTPSLSFPAYPCPNFNFLRHRLLSIFIATPQGPSLSPSNPDDLNNHLNNLSASGLSQISCYVKTILRTLRSLPNLSLC